MVDNNDFLKYGDFDNIIQDMLDNMFEGKDTTEFNGNIYTREELKEEMYKKTYTALGEKFSIEIEGYSSEQAQAYNYTMAKVKRKYTTKLKDTLSFLKNYLMKSMEIGEYLSNNAGVRNGDKITYENDDVTKLALIRIHERSVEVFGEILTLIEHGFNYGAEARWRVLNEYSIVASVLAQEDNLDITNRYLKHEIVGYMRASKEIFINKKEQQEIRKEYNEALELYGPCFKSPYGWYKKDPHISIGELSKKYGNANLTGYTILSNFANHSSSAKFFNFQNRDFTEKINSFETLVQNMVISTNMLNVTLMLYFSKKEGKTTIMSLSIMSFLLNSLEIIKRRYFNERAKVDKTKPDYINIEK